MTLQAATQIASTRPPRIGELVLVRSRRWLVDAVIEAKRPGETCIVQLSCADDDAQGQTLEVFWDYELDRLILEEEGWADLAAKGFDQPRQFAAFLHTLRWNCVTATDPNLFQAPFRAGVADGRSVPRAAVRRGHTASVERVGDGAQALEAGALHVADDGHDVGGALVGQRLAPVPRDKG